MKRAQKYKSPKSTCACGHEGDCTIGMDPGDHGGILGHGPCKECPCDKFTWAHYTDAFVNYMATK